MKKKVLSLMLAGVLFAGMSLNVAAADLDEADATTTITATGVVNYVDTTVYSVTLPTDGCFNFTIDPQGILSATDETTYTPEKYPAGTAGYIVATEGDGAYIKNESSVPIKLMVEAYVTKNATSGEASSVRLMSLAENGAGLTNSGIDNNMMISFDITGETEDGSMLAANTDIKTETVVPYVLAIEKNGAPAADADPKEYGTQISFALNKAAYKFDGTAGAYTYVKDDATGALPGDAVGMRLSGFVNTNADWSAYAGDGAEPIIVKTVFTFNKLATDYELAALDGRAHGVLADVDANYFAGLAYGEDGLPTGATATGEMEYAIGQGALIIPFDLGTGTKELTVTTVTINGGEVVAGNYKVSNGLITLKSTDDSVAAAFAVVAEAADPEGTEIPVAITTSDLQTTTVTVRMYGA